MMIESYQQGRATSSMSPLKDGPSDHPTSATHHLAESTSRTKRRLPAPGKCANCGIDHKKAGMWRTNRLDNDGTKLCNACGLFATEKGVHRNPGALKRSKTRSAPTSRGASPVKAVHYTQNRPSASTRLETRPDDLSQRFDHGQSISEEDDCVLGAAYTLMTFKEIPQPGVRPPFGLLQTRPSWIHNQRPRVQPMPVPVNADKSVSSQSVLSSPASDESFYLITPTSCFAGLTTP